MLQNSIIRNGRMGFVGIALLGTINLPAFSAPALRAGGTMVIRVNSDWSSLDPAFLLSQTSTQVAPVLYDRLVARDVSGKIVPYLAESWTISPKSITFKIRSGVTCSDGSALTAKGVAASLTRLFDPATKTPMLAGAFASGQTFKLAADDSARTVKVDFGNPSADAIYGFANQITGIVCAAGLKNPAAMETQSFGTGAFVLKEAKHGDSITVERRKDWNWGPSWAAGNSSGRPDKLVFKVVTSDTTAANLIAFGGIDIGPVNGPDVARLKADKRVDGYVFSYTQPWQLVANEAAGRPGANPAVRQALFLAISREDFTKAAFDGLGTPSASLLMKGMECYDPGIAALAPQQSLAKAKSVLLAAGYTLGANGKFQKNGTPLKIALLGSVIEGNGPDYVLEQFLSLGVDAILTKLDHASFLANLRMGKFDAAITTTGNTVPLAAIQTVYGSPPPTGQNFASIKDPKIETAMPLALATLGPARCQYWSEVQKALIEGNHWLGLAAPANYWFGKGVSATPVTIMANPVDYTTLKWK